MGQQFPQQETVVLEKTSSKYYLDFSSSIEIDDKRWHFILSSQNYGANYSVYAKFQTTYKEIDGRKEKVLTGADFILKNYKTTGLKLGLRKARIIPGIVTGGIEIDLFVQGMAKEELPDVTCSDIIIRPGQCLQIERHLYPLFYKKTSELNVRDLRNYQSFTSENCAVLDPNIMSIAPEQNSIFDTEFFFGDGNHIKLKTNYDEKDGSLAPGLRCKNGIFRILT